MTARASSLHRALTTGAPKPSPAQGRSPEYPLDSRQVFLLEPDAGIVCRILALYAARGLPLTRASLEHAAPQTLQLVVHSAHEPDRLRILVEKARSLPGVIEAASG